MNTIIRTRALPIFVLVSLCGCSSVQPVASSVENFASRIFRSNPTRAPVSPPSPSLDAYKTQVAYHVMHHNPNQVFSGSLPQMLPAIVVLNITVDKNGEIKNVEVQRSRDPDASRVAVDSMNRSTPLPKPVNLVANNSDSMTFSETFLFDDEYRFQLRSVAGPQ
jgi:periplasmic protein TonB